MNNKTLIVVVGPTAVGKTDVCINLAHHFKTEIISADSRQFYREMKLGTAKPTYEELSEIPHHLVDHLSIHDPYTVKDFEQEALTVISSLFLQRDKLIMTGGSGLYVQALCKGLDDMPIIPAAVRESLMADLSSQGLPFLLEKLKSLDPHYYAIVDKANPQRVVRAIEVSLHTKKPYSTFWKKKEIIRPFDILIIGLKREREELYTRIDTRMDEMIQNGLFEEAKSLYLFRSLTALKTVGYTEIFKHLDGEYDYDEAVRLLKRNSRRYAKRQMTWFNKDETIEWFDPEDIESIKKYLPNP